MGSRVIAVDVGTGSVRAALYDRAGRLVGRGQTPISLVRHGPHVAIQDSADIWQSLVSSVRQAMAADNAAPQDVEALCVDATCSLVLTGKDGSQCRRLHY